MLEKRRESHAARIEIVEKGSQLSLRQSVRAASRQNAQLLEQLARGARDHRGRLALGGAFDFHLGVRLVALPAGESVEAGHEGHALTATRPENLRVAWV